MVGALARRQRAIIVLAVFLGTWLLGSVYAYASPMGASPDEPAHWKYAYALHTRQDASDGQVEVPASLSVNPSACVAFRPDRNARCVPVVTEDPELVTVENRVLSGIPSLYYQLVGWPVTQWSDERGVLISRVLSALIGALLWTVAVLPWTAGRNWLVRLAVILSAAPAALFFSGTIQPSGMEISAFAAAWSLTIAVFWHLRTSSYHSLPTWMQIAWPASILVAMNVRMASVWLISIVLLVVWLWSAVPIRQLLRDRRMVVAMALVAGGAVLRALDFVAARGGDVYGAEDLVPAELGLIRMVIGAAMRLSGDAYGAIGLMGWLDTNVPAVATVYWFLIVGGIVFLAAPFLRRRALASLAVLFGLYVVTAFALDISVQMATGLGLWQPRYGFPLWLGAPILLAAIYVAGTRRQRAELVPVLRWGCALGIVIMHVLSAGFGMARYMFGWTGQGIGALGWTPYAPTTLVTAIAIVASILIGLAVILPGSRPSDPERESIPDRQPEPAA